MLLKVLMLSAFIVGGLLAIVIAAGVSSRPQSEAEIRDRCNREFAYRGEEAVARCVAAVMITNLTEAENARLRRAAGR